jgi:tRNA threonylcarbamoyladenosine biosynthesis protein TsaB
LLLIETSNQPGFVAVAEDERVLQVRGLEESRRQARDLAPAVAELLAARTWQAADISAVVVSRGPGSYTGLRVGVMSAKAFAYAAGCALVTLETFAVIAAQAPPEAHRLAVLADAQQDKVYVQEFEGPAAVAPLSIQSLPAWAAAQAAPLWVSGPGLRKWADQLPAHLRPVEPVLWDPQPASVLRLGLERLRAGQRDDVWAAEPIYLRPSAAEEQWDKRQHG